MALPEPNGQRKSLSLANAIPSTGSRSSDSLGGTVTVVIPITSWRGAERWLRDELLANPIPAGITVVILDNGCDDRFEGPSLESERVTVLRSDVNLGFGGAVKLANHKVAPNASLCWIPGNGKISLSNLLDWLELEIKSPHSVSKALRVGRSGAEALKSRLVEVFLSSVTGARWEDVGGTPTIISPELRQSFFRLAPDGIEIEAFTIAFCVQMSIKVSRSPILYGARAFGQSTWRKGVVSELKLLRDFTKIAIRSLS